MKVQASRGTAEGNRLAHVIERLAEETPALARTRRARAGDGESLLALLLREIDETVLPRRIRLLRGKSEVAQMAVSNRRLYALTIAGERPVTRSVETGDPTSAARLYAHRLQALFAQPGAMRMVVDRGPAPIDPDGLSCAARNLAACIGLTLGPATNSGDLRDVLRGIETLALAWMLTGAKGAEVHHRGPQALVDGLRAFRKGDPKPQMASIRAPRPSCLVLPLPDGRALFRAIAGPDQALAVLPRDAAPAAMDAWFKVFGTL